MQHHRALRRARPFLNLGIILAQPGQLRPDTSNTYGLDALVSNVNTYAVDLANLTQSGTNITLTGAQAIAGVVRLIGTAANNFTVTLPPTARLIDALGPTIAKDGSFAVEISIQNEDPTFTATLVVGDASTTINGTATVEPGTRRIWLLTVGSTYNYTVCSIQNIGTFSTSGGIPGTGTVTSVAQTVPVEFSVSGSPITGAGTLAITKVNENANTVWAGPTSGAPAQPTFRALAAADVDPLLTQTFATVHAETSLANSRTLTAGAGITITDGGPQGPVTITSTAVPSLPQTFATIATEATLANSRKLTAGTGITLTDGGPLGNLTIASTASGGGTLQSQVFNASGTFTPGSGVTGVWLDLYAGGGAGAGGVTAHQGGGGGTGEFCEGFLVPVSGAQTITVGAGGAAGSAGNVGSNGGNTSFGPWTVLGGNAAPDATTSTSAGGNGGGIRGGLGGVGSVGTAQGVPGTSETPSFYGGSGGGVGQSAGGGSGGHATGGAGGGAGGGGGGGSTPLGGGGAGGAANNPGNAGTANTGGGGGGGGNGSSTVGGAGGSGKVVVYWIG